MRPGGQQPGVDIPRLPAATWRLAQRGAVRGFALPERQVIRPALDDLSGLQAERLRARAPHRPGGSPPPSLAWR